MAEVTGRTLAKAVIASARDHGWRVAHFPPVQTERGWRVPVGADGKGWPDLVLVRDRVLFREVKGGGHRPRPEQQAWLDALAIAGEDTGVWTLDDWRSGLIVATLRHRGRGPVEFVPAGQLTVDDMLTGGG